MKVVFPDGSWFVGNRNLKATGFIFPHETKGTHHYFVIDGSPEFIPLKGKEVAAVVSQVKYFIMDYK